MSYTPIEEAEGRRVGTVDFVAPNEIKVQLDLDAPDNTALNTGTPRAFPRINGYVLVPGDAGFIVGQIEWLAVERSSFPKRKGLQDFGLIDLPFPLRRLALNPVGTLVQRATTAGEDGPRFRFQRGVYFFPSIGDPVVLPTSQQLRDIVESGDSRHVLIGHAPQAGNAEVRVDPDRLFGRHLAVLGNTGSGKSCTVAGLIQWCIAGAKKSAAHQPNARFIVLDPNGEYSKTFGQDHNGTMVRVYCDDVPASQLRVPLWFWNSEEWSAFMQASGKAQRPLLRRALREVRGGQQATGSDEAQRQRLEYRRYFSSQVIWLRNELRANTYKAKATQFGYGLKDIEVECAAVMANEDIPDGTAELQILARNTLAAQFKSFEKDGELVEYYTSFTKQQLLALIAAADRIVEGLGGIVLNNGPSENRPIPIRGGELADHLETLSIEENSQQYVDPLLMRIRTMLGDPDMARIIEPEEDISLSAWLESYIGKSEASNGHVTVVDLSLVPSEILHVVTAVIARMTFEALVRYRRAHKDGKTLPTVMVLEEAHNFIRRYNDDAEDSNSAAVCCRTFERIAREGRKFGLGLVLSSQRPSELSPTVLSQCNSFLLHRISNDRDQEGVAKLLPDNLRGILKELPVLPTRHAYLLGWASELPVLTEIRELAEQFRPRSDDPDYWDVWTGRNKKGEPVERTVDWGHLANMWQGNSGDSDTQEPEPPGEPDPTAGPSEPATDNDDLNFLEEPSVPSAAPTGPTRITGEDEDDLPF